MSSVNRGGSRTERTRAFIVQRRGDGKRVRPPVSLAVVQSAAGSEGLVVVLSPADEGHGRPEGGEEPDEHSQSDGAAPLQLCP